MITADISRDCFLSVVLAAVFAEAKHGVEKLLTKGVAIFRMRRILYGYCCGHHEISLVVGYADDKFHDKRVFLIAVFKGCGSDGKPCGAVILGMNLVDNHGANLLTRGKVEVELGFVEKMGIGLGIVLKLNVYNPAVETRPC